MKVNLLRWSFDALRPRILTLVDRFYATLFERYPRVQPMFAHTDMASQKQRLIQALALVVANLERPEVLRETLGLLGAKHAGYGVTAHHYAAVGECLLAAMAETAGGLWTDELAGAWGEAYGAVSGLMQAGAAPVATT
jgi:hemoglobin-like flavoprotein